MECMAIGIGIYGHRLDAHLLARTHDAHGNFTSICDEYFPDHA
jgi:hypothetical protein